MLCAGFCRIIVSHDYVGRCLFAALKEWKDPVDKQKTAHKKPLSSRSVERLVVALISVLFLSTAVMAAFRMVVRPPEPLPRAEEVKTPAVKPAGGPQETEAQTGEPENAAESEAAAEPEPVGRVRREYCYNILISGLDNNNGGSDTNMLMRFDAPGKRIDLVSLPRDTLLHHQWRSNKLNYAYASGGTDLLRSEIENLLGVPVDFYVTVNLRGFISLVDQIGGVDFDVPVNMDYDDPAQDLHIHFTKGMHHLNGQQAMEVVRWRKNNDGSGYSDADIGRIRTQQAFLKVVAKRLLSLQNVPALAEVFLKSVKTDLKLGNLAWLGNEALGIGMDGVHFHTLPGDGTGYYRRESVYVLDRAATLELVNEALNPYNEPIQMEELDILVP